jgi:peptidoglycan/xylan/chitin deacetylase (PgdA/CDA1 family)
VTRRHPRTGAWSVGTAIAVVLFALAGCDVPGVLVPRHQFLRDVYVRGPGTVPVVALTFDDGPNGRCTAEVLDALAATGAPATFFLLGANLEHPDNAPLLARIVREGHTVGLHGWRHSVNPLMDEDWSRHDLTLAREALVIAAGQAGIAPPPVRFYRPPYGFLTGAMNRAAASFGLVVVEWTISVEDWRRGWTAAELSAAIERAARPGDVIVLHDGDETAHRSVDSCVDRPIHADTVRRLVPALRARGLDVAPLATVLALPPSH